MSFFDRFKRLGLKGLFEALINEDVEIILSNGLSFNGKVIKVFDLSLNKSVSVYINLIDKKNQVNIIKVNDVTVVTKDKK